MNFKHKALGLVAALGLAASIAGPVTAQALQTDTKSVSVTLNEAGQFAVSIRSDVTLPPRNTWAGSGEKTTSGNIRIDYVDTLSYRDLSFYAKLQADDFASQTLTHAPFDPVAGPYIIPASNLVILENHNPEQGRWTSKSGVPYRIGDIGATSNGSYNSPQCAAGTGPSEVNPAEGEFEGPGDAGYWDWTISALGANSLDVQRVVACGFEGPGTAADGGDPPWGTRQRILVQLTIPGAQPADEYVSTLHLDVVDNTL